MNLRSICFLDVSTMTANLIIRHKDKFGLHKLRQQAPGSAHHDTETIILRAPPEPSADNWQLDVDHIDYPILKDWKSAKAMLTRIRNAVAPLNGGAPAELGKAMVVSLKPGGHVDWHVDEGEYAEAHDRLHVCLVPSPGAWLYAGGEGAVLPVGQLTWVNNRVLHSAVNMGQNARVHLIVDVRKPGAV